ELACCAGWRRCLKPPSKTHKNIAPVLVSAPGQKLPKTARRGPFLLGKFDFGGGFYQNSAAAPQCGFL
ncbi:hypothetical protein ACVGW8_03650, partial [Enterobacter hormaechei]